MSSAVYPSLKGKRVVVTGGGSGIGAGIVAAFARQGSKVIFLDILENESAALIKSLSDCEHAPVFQRCDLKDPRRRRGLLQGCRADRHPGEQRRQ